MTRQHTGADFKHMITNQSDEMSRQSERYPLLFAITGQLFVVGQPFRLATLRRALDHVLKHRNKLRFTTPVEIILYRVSLPAGTIPGS